MIHQKSSNIKSFRGKKSDPWLSAFMKAFLWSTVSQVNWLNVQLVTSDWHWLKFNKRLLSGRKRTNVTGTAGLPRLRDSSSLMAEAWTCSKLGAQQNWMANGHWLYIDWKKLTWHLLIKLICGPISLSEQTREWKSTRKWFFLPKTNGPKTDQKDPEGSNKKKTPGHQFQWKNRNSSMLANPILFERFERYDPGNPNAFRCAGCLGCAGLPVLRAPDLVHQPGLRQSSTTGYILNAYTNIIYIYIVCNYSYSTHW
jgi:hypothetical protein